MWKTRLETAPRQMRPRSGAMAHRRAVGGRGFLVTVVVGVLFAVMLAGSVYISNRVVGLRAEIARLEGRREFLEAGSAQLLTAWNKATAPAVIIERARRETGLIVAEDPDLVLVQLPSAAEKTSAWRRLLDNVGGADAAQAAPAPAFMSGSMVSLSPRRLGSD